MKYFFLLFVICFANCEAVQKRNTFIITGASGELGGATARQLAHDYDLILTGRDLKKLKDLQEELNITHSGQYRR